MIDPNLSEYWPVVAMFGGTVSALTAYFSKVLGIRETRLKIEHLQRQVANQKASHDTIHLPTPDETARYGKRVSNSLMNGLFVVGIGIVCLGFYSTRNQTLEARKENEFLREGVIDKVNAIDIDYARGRLSAEQAYERLRELLQKRKGRK